MKEDKLSLRRRIANLIFVALGFLFLGVGVTGLVLPILPSTPFFLLTLVCFLKGSKKFHSWFISTKIYKKHLEPFLKTRAMTNAAKVRVLILVTLLISIPIILISIPLILEDALYIRVAMGTVLGAVVLCHHIYFIFFVKSVSKARLYEMLADIKAKEDAGRESVFTGNVGVSPKTDTLLCNSARQDGELAGQAEARKFD